MLETKLTGETMVCGVCDELKYLNELSVVDFVYMYCRCLSAR